MIRSIKYTAVAIFLAGTSALAAEPFFEDCTEEQCLQLHAVISKEHAAGVYDVKIRMALDYPRWPTEELDTRSYRISCPARAIYSFEGDMTVAIGNGFDPASELLRHIWSNWCAPVRPPPRAPWGSASAAVPPS